PLAADVEQAGMEGDRDGKAGEDEIGGVVERVADRLGRADGADDEQPERVQGIDADDAHDDADGDEGKRDVDQRHERNLRPAGQRPPRWAPPSTPLGAGCAPAIMRPSVRSSARPAGTSPMMRPANMTRIRSASDRISSSSTDTTSTAQPWSRLFTSSRWMNS